MQQCSAQMADFIRNQIKSPAAYAIVQLATPDGANVASQFVIDDIITMQITRSTDRTSDTAKFTLSDDTFDYSPITNKLSKYGAGFQPGVVDTKFLLYWGFQGENYDGTANRTPFGYAVNLRYTGFLQTDQQNMATFTNTKGASLADLTQLFRFTVYDTFPHPLYGEQNLSYFDPTYNLHVPNPANPLEKSYATDGTVWICDGKMFTYSSSDPVYGSTHINPNVYVDLTGGSAPTNIPVPQNDWSAPVDPATVGTCDYYSFDYANGAVTFTTAGINYLKTQTGGTNITGAGLPSYAVVSVAGNPTYMAPEVMIRKLMVEKGQWSAEFLQLQYSNILIPMYSGQDNPAWQCISEICDLTCPRFMPWIIYVDMNGYIHFEESVVDSPIVKTFIDERDFITAQYSFSSQNISTVVRAEGECFTSEGDQAVTGLAYSQLAINKYGQTEALLLDKHLSYNVSHLSTTGAIAYLNMMTASVLSQVDRPTLTLQAQIWPDPTIEINDKIAVRSASTGITKQFLVSGLDEEIGAGSMDQSLTAVEYVDSANYLIGLPSAVTYATDLQPAATAPPQTSLVSWVRCGSNVGPFVYKGGQPVTDATTGEYMIGQWYYVDGTPMRFDVFFDAMNASQYDDSQNPYYYTTDGTHLPPDCDWSPPTGAGSYQAPGQNYPVFYGTQPAGGSGNPANPGWTTYVGPDSIFYSFNHTPPIAETDLESYWTPTGNAEDAGTTGPKATGTTQWTGYVWCWWYLCLDGSNGRGQMYRPAMQPTMTYKDGSGDTQTLAQGGQITVKPNTGFNLAIEWNKPPGPTTTGESFLFGDLAVGISNFTPTPPGFVGAAVYATGIGGGDSGNTLQQASEVNAQQFYPLENGGIIVGDQVQIVTTGTGGVNNNETFTVDEVSPPAVAKDGIIYFTTKEKAQYAHNIGDPVNPIDTGTAETIEYGVAFGNSLSTVQSYINYQKVTRGHFCLFVMSTDGASQFLRVPFDLYL